MILAKNLVLYAHMIITYYGGSFFKLQVGDTVIGYDPISKDSKLKTTKFGADIGLISINHLDHNGAENLAYGEKQPLIINGPGEYEAKDIFIRGYGVETTYGGEKKINTIYTILFEGMNLCFLGAIGSPSQLTSDLKEKLAGVEILFVPIGGGEVLDPADAYNKVAVSLEPNIIIPMHFEQKGKELATFLKEGGDGSEELDKLTIKKKDLAGKEGDVVVLKPAIA